MSVLLTESSELPIYNGTIEVDTRKGAVTIFMSTCVAHKEDEMLIITKVSKDSNIVCLYSETTLIDGSDILMFGVPTYAKVSRGKIKTLYLKCDGKCWKIVKEE